WLTIKYTKADWYNSASLKYLESSSCRSVVKKGAIFIYQIWKYLELYCTSVILLFIT
ncbi:15515_t:CDS:1, partial [Racocetra persica]